MSSQSLNIAAATLAAPAYFTYRGARWAYSSVATGDPGADDPTAGVSGKEQAAADAPRRAQQKLEEERKAQLAQEAAARADAANRAANRGSSAGRDAFGAGGPILGFSGVVPPAGAGRGRLFGN